MKRGKGVGTGSHGEREGLREELGTGRGCSGKEGVFGKKKGKGQEGRTKKMTAPCGTVHLVPTGHGRHFVLQSHPRPG